MRNIRKPVIPPNLPPTPLAVVRRAPVRDDCPSSKASQIKNAAQPSDTFQVTGPLDVIGDVHGCYDELVTLLEMLGYTPQMSSIQDGIESLIPLYTHPEGRQPVFVGDFVDRGPKSAEVLALIANLIRQNRAYGVIGNHDDKLMRHLSPENQQAPESNRVKINNVLQTTVDQIVKYAESTRQLVADTVYPFLRSLPAHAIFDKGKLVVAHAGLEEADHGQVSSKIRHRVLYGKTSGEKDGHDWPIRQDWTESYQGKALVAYGHTPYSEVYENNNTVDLDTGCVFGGKLTAFRYPERVFVSTPALKTYAQLAEGLPIPPRR